MSKCDKENEELSDIYNDSKDVIASCNLRVETMHYNVAKSIASTVYMLPYSLAVITLTHAFIL